LWDYVAPGSRQTLLDAVAELDQAELDGSHPKSTNMVLEMLCRDGSTVWVETLCTILYNETGRLVGMQGVCRDITDRIRIQALREDVERMARHDLKTPLSAVIGLPQEIMNDDNLNARQREMLGVIAKAGESMLELVNRSLDLHKMETGTYELDAQVIDICALIEQIMAEIRPLAAKKSLSFALDTGDSDCMISGEGVLLHSMLSNLIKNAIEAAPEESAISIAIKHAGQWRRIVIRNKGSVPQSLRETFFDKYSRNQTSKGSGLGTYSARLVARTHGGDISLDTTRPGETTLVVSLPPI
jgi:signal transduction histidine kinase